MANCRYCGTDCPEQGEHDKFFDCALYAKRIPTNADRIRSMSDEELYVFLLNATTNGIHKVETYVDLFYWLQQPAETEGKE